MESGSRSSATSAETPAQRASVEIAVGVGGEFNVRPSAN
jgi:hypothetical protein